MQNKTMMQFFEWYCAPDGCLWNELKKQAQVLTGLGITSLWLPPAYKGLKGKASEGYDVYDLFDLGEFYQQGTVSTKYGTKGEYIDAVKAAKAAGLRVYIDVVLNHMAGGEKELVKARKVDGDNRNEFTSDIIEMEAHTRFTFPARKGKYSTFYWDHNCFTGFDCNEDGRQQIYCLQNKFGDNWQEVFHDEKGNYDFLMHCDINYRNPAVRREVKKWIRWYYNIVQFDGIRLDAVKHIPTQFLNGWIDYVKKHINPELFFVGECWFTETNEPLLKYIDITEGRMHLFDPVLHHKFHYASKNGSNFDLTTIFNDTLVAAKPELSVTFVENHDTQPLQALEAVVEHWFKPIAYAIILLRQDGYPCIFHPDLYGSEYTGKGFDGNDYEIHLPKVEELEMLLLLRKGYAYGLQRDYFDDRNCIGWVREGIDDFANSGLAVLISNESEAHKYMEMGKRHAGKKFIDYLNHYKGSVMIDENGYGEFHVLPCSVSVWVEDSDHEKIPFTEITVV